MSVSLYRAFAAAHSVALSLIPEANRWSVRRALRERLRQVERVELPSGGSMSVFCDHPQVLSRVERVYSKEPHTIAWLNGLDETDILWDIGANVGIYSLYAALERGARVMAFEPMRENFEALQANVRLNKIGDKVSAIPLAASDEEALGHFFVRNSNVGSSGHQFGRNVDERGEEFEPADIESVLAARLDCLIDVFRMPAPTYLKIDVDGLELKVIAGAGSLLRHPKLKSVLVEANYNAKTIEKELAEAGLTMAVKDGGNCIFARGGHEV